MWNLATIGKMLKNLMKYNINQMFNLKKFNTISIYIIINIKLYFENALYYQRVSENVRKYTFNVF